MEERFTKSKIFIVIGTLMFAGAIFWMSTYLLGPVSLIPGAFVLAFLLWHYRKKVPSPAAYAEHYSYALLLSSQVTLLIAVVYEILPLVVKHIS